MSLLETVERVRESLERNGRISYRMLRREFALDDDALEELIEELVDIQRVAVREERALAWNSAATPRAQATPAAAATAASVPHAERKPLDYTPRHLADKILQSRSALEGERKLVTVMFADVSGSMELAEALDVEVWHRVLDRFFQILTDGVHRFEGTVNQYTGDGIMALFGAPIAHEDHAQRACYTALELRAELRGYADEVRRKHGVSFSTRIGLNSGEVVVGKIGDDLRMDYTAQGHTVGLAQRMEGLAEPGSVFLTEHTARLVEGYFALRSLGGFELKGATEPLDVFELEGVGTHRTRLDRSRARGFSRLIGRGRELETLDGALQRSLAGHGQIVGVVAEAGVGKSRLCLEFLESCRAQGLAVHEAHCPPHGRTVHLLPIFELLRGVFGITDADRDQAAREKIAGRLLLLDREFDPQLPLIWEFLGVPDADRPAPTLDASARQRQLYAFIRQQVQARSRREPAVLFFDDLHWVDPGSDGFLAQMVEVVQATRTLVVVNFRPEYRADWMQRSYYQQLALAPLGPDDIRALASELLGAHPSVAELPAAIASRTLGNPFFTEEVVQTLAESGQLSGRRGAYQLKGELRGIQVPATVQAILAARIDRLPELQKRVLQTAAVIGKEFPESLLRAVIELSDDDLRAAISGLQAAEFLYERALYPEHEYAFKHPLTHEVAYASQLAERRRPLHAAVARAIEARDPDRVRENAALLAHHWDAADEPEPAAEWHRHAAIAIGMLDLDEAVRHWERVRELLDRLPESQAQLARASEARSRILWFRARSAIPLDPGVARKLFEEACERGERGGNSAAVVDVKTSYATFVLYRGDIRECLRLSAQAIAEADRLGDRQLAAVARWPAAVAHYFRGEFERTIEICGQGLALCAGDPDVGVESMAFNLFAFYHAIHAGAAAYLGRAADAVAEIAWIDTPAGRKHGYSFHVCGMFRPLVSWLTGDYRTGLAQIRQVIDGFGPGAPLSAQVMSQHTLGIALSLVEEWDEADAAFTRALEVARGSGSYLHQEAETLARLARCAAERGEFERARALAEAAEAAAERIGVRLTTALVPFARARILWRERGAAAAVEIERELASSLAASRSLGIRLLDPAVWLERAALAEARGQSVERRAHLQTAHALWLEMGSERNAARVEKLLAQAS